MVKFSFLSVLIFLGYVAAAPAIIPFRSHHPNPSTTHEYIITAITTSDVYTYTSVSIYLSAIEARITTIPLQPEGATTTITQQPTVVTTILQQEQPAETTTVYYQPHVTTTVVEVYSDDEPTTTAPAVIVTTVTRTRPEDITVHSSHHHTTTIYLDEPEPTTEAVVDITVTMTSTSTLAATHTAGVISVPFQSHPNHLPPNDPLGPGSTISPDYYPPIAPWSIPEPVIPTVVPPPNGFPSNATCYPGDDFEPRVHCSLDEKDVSGCVEDFTSALACAMVGSRSCVVENCIISPGGVNATCHRTSFSLRLPPSYECSPIA